MKPLLALLLMAAAGSVQAHAYLQRSEPPANSAIAAPPKELRLRYSEPVEPAFVEVTVTRDGKPVQTGKPQVDEGGRRVRLAVDGGEPGAWVVHWSLVAKDGHRTKGQVAFIVKPR